MTETTFSAPTASGVCTAAVQPGSNVSVACPTLWKEPQLVGRLPTQAFEYAIRMEIAKGVQTSLILCIAMAATGEEIRSPTEVLDLIKAIHRHVVSLFLERYKSPASREILDFSGLPKRRGLLVRPSPPQG